MSYNPEHATPIWRPFTQMKTAEPPLPVTSAQDALLHLADGREIVDAISSWWVITHGHRQPEILAAISDQITRLDQVIFADFTHEPAEEVAAALVSMMPPGLGRVFFSDNGSTSVEIALKMALQACKQNGQLEKTKFIAFSEAYHGDTVGAMSVSADGVFTQAYRELMFPVLRVRQGRLSSDTAETFVADFRETLERHHREVAAVILEPLIQGAAGMIVWPVEAVQDIERLCRAHGVYLIFDEVMTGFGRTGACFAFERAGVAPDLLCLAKGLTGGVLPLAVTIASEEIFSAFYSDDRSHTFFHGHSFTANPIACAAALANLKLIGGKEMPRNWRRIENIHQERLARLGGRGILKDQRQCGVVAAIEIESGGGYLDNLGPAIRKHALAQGVLLRPLGNVLYVLPPYSITDQQLHQVWDVVESCVELAESLAPLQTVPVP